MTRLIGAAALILAVIFARASSADDEITILKRHGVYIVKAEINDRYGGDFLLDTGATYCTLTREAARKARIRGAQTGERIRLSTANGTVEARLGEARRVRIGDTKARGVAVAIIEEDPVPGLAGIIGNSFLSKFEFTIDADEGVLRLGK